MMNRWRLFSSFILQSIWKIEDNKTAKEQIIHATKKRRSQDLVLSKDKDTCDRKLSLQVMWLLQRRISLTSTGPTLSGGSRQAASYYPIN